MADIRGSLRRIDDPEGEVMRLARERQILAGQICAEGVRYREASCPEWRQPPGKRSHDPAHCDRAYTGWEPLRER